ncbi:MAG: hypothetical protein K0Q67_1245 [Cellvibrio sp.]|jgi:hypothetical protein|nr:hypothetical protein [Cellvibrio sp.]MDF3014207.1 hypothetical protein [Cellvibrio sp.]
MKTTLFYRFMCWYDAHWRRRHRVEKFDELLSFSFETFSGKRRVMNDGTWIEPGDCLAILHFNRECFAHPAADPRQHIRNALRFRRLLLASFAHLAKAIHENEKFRQVKAFHGVSWLPPHGEKLGFVIERLPDSALNLVRKFYFTILLRVFFPHLVDQENNRIHPHAYWLTRDSLLKNFSAE